MEDPHDETSATPDGAQNGARETDRARRRAIIRAAVDRSHREMLRHIQENEAEIRAAEAERGILERLIGYRTHVPGL